MALLFIEKSPAGFTPTRDLILYREKVLRLKPYLRQGHLAILSACPTHHRQPF